MSQAAVDATVFRFFAVSAPGLELLLQQELAGLGAEAKLAEGGVEGAAPREVLWRLHRQSALAESLRVRLKPFKASTFAGLESDLAKLPWHVYVAPGTPLDVRVSCKQSRLYHSQAVAERVERVVTERLAGRQVGEGSIATSKRAIALRVYVRLVNDLVTISIDTSGQLLHRRGYRKAVETAPMRETLAAAMVLLLHELAGEPPARVWDPFCGSGVLALEWLRTRLGKAPGELRRFAFERWPSHPSERWQAWLQEQEGPGALPDVHAWSSDVDDKAVRSTLLNAAALLGEGSSVTTLLSCQAGDFRSVAKEVPKGTAVLANPPHGKRIGSTHHSNELYDSFEKLLLERRDLRPVVLACGHQPFVARALSKRRGGLAWKRLARTKQGGLPLSLLGLS